MVPTENILYQLKEGAERPEPTAPPMSDIDHYSGSPEPPDLLKNIHGDENGDKYREKLIPAKNKPDTEPQGPWKTKNLGELVNDDADPLKIKRKRRRKVKKALGWAFWITCAPLAVVLNLIRDSPIDPDDPLDWNNDPLRPWNYKVNLDTKVR